MTDIQFRVELARLIQRCPEPTVDSADEDDDTATVAWTGEFEEFLIRCTPAQGKIALDLYELHGVNESHQ